MALYLRYGLMLLALALAAYLLRSASKNINIGESPAMQLNGARTPTSLPRQDVAGLVEAHEDEDDAQSSPALVDDVYTSKLSEDARRRLKAKHLMYEEIKSQVTSQPENTAELIHSWIVTDLKHS